MARFADLSGNFLVRLPSDEQGVRGGRRTQQRLIGQCPVGTPIWIYLTQYDGPIKGYVVFNNGKGNVGVSTQTTGIEPRTTSSLGTKITIGSYEGILVQPNLVVVTKDTVRKIDYIRWFHRTKTVYT